MYFHQFWAPRCVMTTTTDAANKNKQSTSAYQWFLKEHGRFRSRWISRAIPWRAGSPSRAASVTSASGTCSSWRPVLFWTTRNRNLLFSWISMQCAIPVSLEDITYTSFLEAGRIHNCFVCSWCSKSRTLEAARWTWRTIGRLQLCRRGIDRRSSIE